MKVLIAADLHGVTVPLREMLAPVVGQAIYLSPWDTDASPFPNEQAAHRAFLAGDGFESYAAKIAVAAGDEPAFIIGFSVGASAAWLHAASGRGDPRSVATLFYGSRIRDYASRSPRFDVTAIFAQREASFSPAGLARVIAGDRVRTIIEAETAHGFMNPCSANFVPASCSTQLQRLAAELARFERRVG